MAISQATSISLEKQPIMIRPLKLVYESDMENESTITPAKILSIIYKYRLIKEADAHDKWVEGTPKFLNIIDNFVKTGKPIRMCMPAFPFKSANKVYKVLGILPDRAEEAALDYMNTMCAEIAAIYKPGAKLLIISDGLVYNGKCELVPEARLAIVITRLFLYQISSPFQTKTSGPMGKNYEPWLQRNSRILSSRV